ncbi:MAG: hypothetical protein H6R47_289 [Proteobacteria bacterium]|nr:hypothetical protein [Pseudomonadota bacterium]
MLPATVFALAVLVLRAIPVLGDIVLLLLLPSVLTSYVLHVHLIALTGSAPRAKRSGGAAAYQRWARELRHALFGVWSKTENIFPLFLVGLVLVVLGLIIHVLFSQAAGQGAVSPYGFFELSPEQMTRLLLGYGLAALLWIGVMVLLLWTLPLFALRDMALLEAVAWNVRAFFSNVAAVLLMLLVLAAGLVPAMLLKPWSLIGQVVALWLSLTLLAALFVCSAYCSYRLVFAADTPPRPAAPPPPGARPRPTPPGPRRS